MYNVVVFLIYNISYNNFVIFWKKTLYFNHKKISKFNELLPGLLIIYFEIKKIVE